MGGLYNAIFGENPFSDILLEIIGLKKEDTGRFRDCFIHEENGKTFIAVFTRNGGGNRGCWEDGKEGCNCYGCRMIRLEDHPLYVRDFDDDYDCTYATTLFAVPSESLRLLEFLEGIEKTEKPMVKFRNLLNDIEIGEPTEHTKKAFEIGKRIFESIRMKGVM
jgi:hypothetical protein